MKKLKEEGFSLPIGELVLGLPRPVFFDPHFPIGVNSPPVTFISGSPGSGKTFAGLLLAMQSILCNKVNFILDPKGDFAALKTLEKKGIVNDVKIWSILHPSSGTVSQKNIGMLDPTMLYPEKSENVTLTVDVISQLAGGITPKQKTRLIPIIQDVVKQGKDGASFRRVAMALKSNQDDEIRSLGFTLEVCLDLEISQLLVRPRKKTEQEFLSLDSGTVVASLLGLNLPPESKDPASYSTQERISVVIMWLLTSMVLRLMKTVPKSRPKTLIIDEAWSVMSSQAGADMIAAVALLGRSINMATILCSQSPTHLMRKSGEASLNNSISTRMAFRNKSEDDNLMTVDAMGLPAGESWESVIPKLEVGSCLMQDTRQQTGIVHITVPDDLAEMFNTNPLKEMQKKQASKDGMS